MPLVTRVAVVASLTALLAIGCKKPEGTAELTSAKQDSPPISVQTAPAVERAMPEHLVLTGTLRASQESEVAADAAGREPSLGDLATPQITTAFLVLALVAALPLVVRKLRDRAGR